jgi:endonuclease YncB( thermonuclease family)
MKQIMKRLLVILLILIFLQLAIAAPDEAIGRVVSILGGDSFGIQMGSLTPRTKQIDRVKLADIVSPSTLTPQGKIAKEFTASILKNKTVYLDIDDNSVGGRNSLGQLICVVYLIDSESRPIWPCFNRMLVDNGYAVVKDDKNNEFNPSTWWQKAPNMNLKRSVIIAAGRKPKYRNDTIVLKKDSTSSLISIGYRHSYFGKGETEKILGNNTILQ